MHEDGVVFHSKYDEELSILVLGIPIFQKNERKILKVLSVKTKDLLSFRK